MNTLSKSIILSIGILGFSTLLSLPTAAQSVTPQTEAGCGFDHRHQQKLLTNEGYARGVSAFNNRNHQLAIANRDAGTLFVPLVVHVLETGAANTAITDDQVRQGVRWLNERYRKVAGTSGAGAGVDTHIEFALAVRDPNGNCTNGITRHNMIGNTAYMNGGVQGAGGISDDAVKAIGAWDSEQYYNIWLVNYIDDGGTNGYAYFASSHGEAWDGTVMATVLMKDPVATTLAHEIGHALNLYHTFEGDVNGTTCPLNATCATQGDRVCDTPPHIRTPGTCDVSGTNSCDGGSSNALFRRNYLDYSSAACRNMFTAGQDTRIQSALIVDRASLLASNGNMSLVPVSAPLMDISASASLLCGTGQSVQFFDNSTCIPNTFLRDPDLAGITFAWTITNGVNTYTSDEQNPVVTLGSTGAYSATLTTTTSLGSYTRTEQGIVVVTANPVAACIPTSLNPSANYGLTVSRVVFNTIDNSTSTGINFPYTDYACTNNTVVAPGQTYPLAVTINGVSGNTEIFQAYIDWNNNGTFEDPSELVGSGSQGAGQGTVTVNVTIPGGAVTNTLLRLRVYGETGTLSAAERTCSTALLVADVEDYGVYVSNSLARVTIAASPSSTISYGTNVTFTPTPVNGGGSPVYTWFRNGAQVAIGATYSSNTLVQGETIHCSMASSLSTALASPALSNTITMTVTGAPLSDFSSSRQTLCAGSTVSFTDASLLAPTSWSWSFPGGTPATSTAQNPVITYNTPGTYAVTLTASNGFGTGTTQTKTAHLSVSATPTAGCVVTRSTAPAAGIGITRVRLNTIDHRTAYDDAAMNDFTCSRITTLTPGATYTIKVNVGTANNQWLRVYIDYNGDGDFVDANEQIFAPATGVGVRTGSFTVPASPPVLNNLLRMRVITDFVNTTAGPCTTPLQYGQVEEYGVRIVPLPNTAPVLNAAATPVLNGVNEDAAAPVGAVGTLVSALVDLTVPAGGLDNVTDPDVGAVTGVAIIAADASNGTWSYSINGGTNWNALGTPTATVSRLLAADANTRLYFQPNANYNGTIASAITFRAWDRTTGTNGSTDNASVNGGTTAYSTATDVAALSVSAVNDAPVNTVPGAQSTPMNQALTFNGGNSISVADIDVATSTMQMALSATNGVLSLSGITGLSFSIGDGTNDASMTFTGTLVNVNAALSGLTFAPTNNFTGAASITITSNDLGNTGSGGPLTDTDVINITVTATDVQLALRVFLEGPYDAATGLMNDALRSGAMLPGTEPYTAMGYSFVGGGGETVLPAVLAVNGNNAIVDWVIVELRDNATPTTIVASKAALLQRDGDVVATDGTTALSFTLPSASYRVAVLHRNHLGAMTQSGVLLTASPTTVNLASNATTTYGTDARRSISGAFPTEALWSGDANFDGEVLYTGSDNDRDLILVRIGGAIPTNEVSGYDPADVNMDGIARYTGGDNDRDRVLQTIGGVVPTTVRAAQLP